MAARRWRCASKRASKQASGGKRAASRSARVGRLQRGPQWRRASQCCVVVGCGVVCVGWLASSPTGSESLGARLLLLAEWRCLQLASVCCCRRRCRLAGTEQESSAALRVLTWLASLSAIVAFVYIELGSHTHTQTHTQ